MKKNRIFFILITIYSLIITPIVFAKDTFGHIAAPDWLSKWGTYSDVVGPNFGLIKFLSNILRLLTVIAGLYGMFNLIMAGYGFINSSGEPEKIKQANDKIFMSLLGLVIIAASYVIAAIIGWLLFGSATAIISPNVYGPGV